jgi:Mismatch repair ATPase (MutS family)
MTTPMLQQYRGIKEKVPGTILFYRLGDFYEMFGDDAELAAPILQIALTGRDAGDGKRIAMCGVPYHALDNYLAKLVKTGHKVAICEQVEDAKKCERDCQTGHYPDCFARNTDRSGRRADQSLFSQCIS